MSTTDDVKQQISGATVARHISISASATSARNARTGAAHRVGRTFAQP
jgi:hypothetical protein